MSRYTGNPTAQAFYLCREFGWNPQIFEDQKIVLPSFKNVLRWIVGKPLSIVLRKGIDAKQIESFITILSEEHLQEEEKQQQMINEAKLRIGKF